MNFSLFKSFQVTVRNCVRKILTPPTLQPCNSRGIHHTCSRFSILNTNHYQSPGKPVNYLSSTLGPTNFLAPTVVCFNQVCGLKVKGNLILRCKGCYYFAREGVLHVMCKLKPRHKQVQMQKKFKNRRILTFAHQKKISDW
ncbi:uncharacterized protein LOC106638893 [Copidosoma floridanum]|uniref:uncharacterized protein LOC106638893 n=1 Tax=Copidosoma floridanum TaxID=29053 RepID=UPI0006C960CC|nr:uncharacterized protein LOC106638893 [Copidosoma floridanum]